MSAPIALTDIDDGSLPLPGWREKQRRFPYLAFKRSTPARIYPHAEIDALPDNLERAYMNVRGVQIECRIMRAEKERGVLAAVSGFKSPNPLHPETVAEYNAQGISVIWMALPNPGKSLGFMPFFKRCVDQFLLDKTSPLYTAFNPELKRFLHGHSTGGFLGTRLLLGKKSGSFMREHFEAATMDAPFFDTANASLDDNFVSRHMFTIYALMHPYSLPQNTLMGRVFLHHDKLNRAMLHLAPLPDAKRIEKIGFRAALLLRASVRTVKEFLPGSSRTDFFEKPAHHNQEFIVPTYGQMLEIRGHGRQFYRKCRQQDVEAGMPVLMIGGKGDPASSTLQIMKTATHIGAEFYQANAGHATIDTDIDAKQKALSFIVERLPAWPTPDEETIPETQPAAVARRWPDYIRAKFGLAGAGLFGRTAGQRGAGFLNTLTGAFQRAFRGRVADTEVRGEPEGRTLNAGHAHALQ